MTVKIEYIVKYQPVYMNHTFKQKDFYYYYFISIYDTTFIVTRKIKPFFSEQKQLKWREHFCYGANLLGKKYINLTLNLNKGIF